MARELRPVTVGGLARDGTGGGSEPRADASGPVDEQVRALRALADAIEALGGAPTCRIVPFSPGRRPTFEAAHPGHGSSDGVALLTGGGADNRTIVLFEAAVGHGPPPSARLAVTATVRWADGAGGRSFSSWQDRPLHLDGSARRHRLELSPDTDVAAEDVGFAHGFLRSAVVRIAVTWDGVPVAADEALIHVCDIRNLGTLYQRLLDRIVGPDAEAQSRRAGLPDVGAVHHAWYPVLQIGMDKAALYTQAIVADVVSKEAHLADPAWLLRVGVYLELLTCLGIIEAVRDEVGDVLTAQERLAFDTAPELHEIRARLDVAAWRRVCELRTIAFPRVGVPRAGPVSITNLLYKKRATMAFLHTHHDDLRHAIELAGANRHNAQETWQRVFRDAERAVLRKTADVFPELEHLPPPMRDVVLWQQRGIAGQQGLYPTACTQYRASMNQVAAWAKDAELMDYTGPECVPLRVSLLSALMNEPHRVPILQRGDRYDDTATLTTARAVTAEHHVATEDFEALLTVVPILQLLAADDLRALALRARPIFAMPGERLIIQGDDGGSLYIVVDGTVEVMLRRDGRDQLVDTMGRGAVFGEMALLTGEKRTATVRALDTAVVFEIAEEDYRPLIQAHPEWIDVLARTMADRLQRRETRLSMRRRRRSVQRISDHITRRFLAPA